MTTRKALLLAGAALLGAITAARADDDRRAGLRHVLLISVDGMHEVDLRLWVQTHPRGALAKLSDRGVTYSRAYTTAPSDSFPGMIAQVTGGTPKSAGVFYDDSYDRTFFPPQSDPNKTGHAHCDTTPGAETTYAENIDKTLADYTGGGTLGKPLTQIDPANLPQTIEGGVCTPVYPHQFIRVNTLFEVLRNHGYHTAWSDKHPAYEILSGPSGAGIEDLYTPEINAQATDLNFANILPPGNDFTKSFGATRYYDGIKVDAVIRQIQGLDSTGLITHGYTPAIYGMNFQAVSVGQKLTKSGDADVNEQSAGLTGGYTDAAGTPGAALKLQLQFVDDSIGKMVGALQATGQYDSTLIIISAKHGQSPIDPNLFKKTADNYGAVLAKDGYGFNIADDASLIWLDPTKRTKAIYEAALDDLQKNAAALGIQSVITRRDLTSLYRDPFNDNRTPDFFVVSNHGVVYTGGDSKIAEHGGVADDDRHVALLVSAPGLDRRTVDRTVFTTQIAPTILSTFRISPAELQAVQQEGTPVLPGLSDERR